MSNEEYPISVHLVTFNSSLWLPYSLGCLKKQTRQDFFLLIIDNGSFDNSTTIVEEFLAANPSIAHRARLVRNKQNVGFAKAHNQALAWTDSKYVLPLNPDLLLSENYLEVLAKTLDEHDDAGAVTGKILRWNFEPETFHLELLKSTAQNQIDSAGLAIKRSRQVYEIGRGEIDKGQYEAAHQVFGVTGAAPMYRRLSVNNVSVNGEIFDEDFVSYKEDVDLAWRLRLGGYSAWYEPKTTAYHDRRLNAYGTIVERIKVRKGWPSLLKVYSLSNHLAVLIKNDSLLNLLKDSPWILTHEIGKIGYYLITEPPIFFKSTGRLIKLTGKFIAKRFQLKSTHKLKAKSIRAWFSS